MVIRSSALRGRVLRFQSPAGPPATLQVVAVDGEDEISET